MLLSEESAERIQSSIFCSEFFSESYSGQRFFLSVVWLPHCQLWAIIKWTRHSPDVNNYVIQFRSVGPLSMGQFRLSIANSCIIQSRPEDHREPRNEVQSLGPVERLVGFEPQTFNSITTP